METKSKPVSWRNPFVPIQDEPTALAAARHGEVAAWWLTAGALLTASLDLFGHGYKTLTSGDDPPWAITGVTVFDLYEGKVAADTPIKAHPGLFFLALDRVAS